MQMILNSMNIFGGGIFMPEDFDIIKPYVKYAKDCIQIKNIKSMITCTIGGLIKPNVAPIIL